MPRIACLHTVDSNVPVFDAALAELGLPGIALQHHVRADLLAEAEKQGGLTPGIAAEAAGVLRGLCDGADAVLLTCSTLGPAAEQAAADAPKPVLRVDATLAAEAVRDGGAVTVLCAVETTVDPTRRLFERAAEATGAAITMQVVPHAWEAFKAGDRDRYFALIARAGDEALRAGAARVALAQASMAGASRLATGGTLLNSPAAGLKAVAGAAGEA